MGKMQRWGGLISLFSCAATRPRELVRESPASLLALVYPFLSLGLDGFQRDSFLTAERKQFQDVTEMVSTWVS